MSVGFGVGVDVVEFDEREELVPVASAQCSGWLSVVEYVPTASAGVVQPVVKNVFVGWFGRTAPAFKIATL